MEEEILTLIEDPKNPTDFKVVFDPETEKPVIATELHSEDIEEGVDKESYKSDGFDAPIVLLNQQVLGPDHIKSLTLKCEGFVPTLELVVNDTKGDIQFIGGPGLRNHVAVILCPAMQGVYRSISMPFYIKNRVNETESEIKYECEYHNLGLSDIKCMQIGDGQLTTYEFFEKISKILGFGFATTEKCKDVQDKRFRQSYSQRFADFIQEQVNISGTSEEEILDAWIDTHGYINLINLSWVFDQDVKAENLSIVVQPKVRSDNKAAKENEPFEVQRTLMDYPQYPIDNLKIDKKYNELTTEDTTDLGTDTTFWCLTNIGEENKLDMQDVKMKEESIEGKDDESAVEYTFKKTVFLGCEMSEDTPYLIQKEIRKRWIAKKRAKCLTVELVTPNYGIERGTLINVGIFETDPAKIRKIYQNIENTVKETKVEDEPFNIDDSSEPPSIGDITNSSSSMTNPALSGMYYIDGIRYVYDGKKVTQVLFLIKKGEDNNLFHAKASPTITTEQQSIIDGETDK